MTIRRIFFAAQASHFDAKILLLKFWPKKMPQIICCNISLFTHVSGFIAVELKMPKLKNPVVIV